MGGILPKLGTNGQDEADALQFQKEQERIIRMEKDLLSSRTDLETVINEKEELLHENNEIKKKLAEFERKLQQQATTHNLELRQVVGSPQEVVDGDDHDPHARIATKTSKSAATATTISSSLREMEVENNPDDVGDLAALFNGHSEEMLEGLEIQCQSSLTPTAAVPMNTTKRPGHPPEKKKTRSANSSHPSKRRKTNTQARSSSRLSHDANRHDMSDDEWVLGDEWVPSSDQSESDDESSETNRVMKRTIPKRKCSNTSRVMKRTIPKRKCSSGAKKSSSKSKQRRYTSFKQRVEQLQIYKKANGHCNVPFRHSELGRWVSNVRLGQRKIRLSDNQKKRLAEMGFQWRLRKIISFDQRVEQLQDFIDIHGHCDVPKKDPELGIWVQNLRSGGIKLSDEQRKNLDRMKFQWSVRPRRGGKNRP